MGIMTEEIRRMYANDGIYIVRLSERGDVGVIVVRNGMAFSTIIDRPLSISRWFSPPVILQEWHTEENTSNQSEDTSGS